AEALKDVTTSQQFGEKAKQLSEDDLAPSGGDRGRVGPDYFQLIGDVDFEKLGNNVILGPKIIDNRVYAFWVGDRSPSSVRPLSEVENNIRLQITSEAKSAYSTELRAAILQENGLNILFPH